MESRSCAEGKCKEKQEEFGKAGTRLAAVPMERVTVNQKNTVPLLESTRPPTMYANKSQSSLS